ncbi:MAG: HlyD family efflux transporter periplasmic adaptor subunit [Candidatus Tectomicrobia bacterium]|uniref:HlyD family efflux transporter periplasmic adaptor subunit n=1 Tax=Tectimicrobiota bacterium TaxID=2528274 RepID=A0A932ZSF9_UNCTE|nr:HlyD family efflux transporter periplasmic adaptor subunit [Candidatus Tectomicrobia bacterium]
MGFRISRKTGFALAATVVLAAGLGVSYALIRSRPSPAVVRPAAEGRLVRAVRLKKEEKTLWVSGYGTVRPKTEVQIVPEVSGRLIQRAPGFRSGGFIQKGDLLFEVDPRDYALAAAQRRAQIAQLEADIQRLLQEEKNTRADLTISERQLKLVEAELERNRRLRQQGVVSEGQFETTLQSFLRQERAVLAARNALDLIPPQLAQKRAAIRVSQAQLEEAHLSLERTKYLAPFDGRVRQVKAEVGDYLRAGQSIGSIHGMAVVEIPVSVPVDDARWVFRRVEGVTRFPRSQEEVQRFFPGAEVVWSRFGQTFRWEGRVTLVDAGLDEATRAITLIVEVAEPLKNWVPGQHPPLIAGMFVRARIRGIAVPDVFVIPRAALHAGDRVHIFHEGRLDIRPVQVLRKDEGEAVVRNGVREGEWVILSAIPDPVPGLKLRLAEAPAAEPGAQGGPRR